MKNGSWQELKNIYNLYTIRRKQLKKSPVWLVSIICTVGYLGVMYSVSPAFICSCYLLSAIYLFFLCEFISMSLHEKENDIFEEVLLLHCESDVPYYLSREMLQLRMCFIFAVILTIYPVLKSWQRPGFFVRNPEAIDVLCGGAVILFSGICGIETADFFHSRLLSRKFGVCFLILVSLLSLCKEGLIETLAVFKILNILMPPVTDGLVLLGSGDNFDKMGILLIVIHMMIFSIVITILKIKLLQIKKFRT